MPINVHGAKHMLPAPEEPEFRKWTRELFSDSQLVSETLMFARLTDNPDCVKSVLCDFAFKPKELFRDECVIRLADLSPKSVKDYQDFVSPSLAFAGASRAFFMVSQGDVNGYLASAHGIL